MRRHLLAISASALALAVVPTLALGAQGNGAAAEAGAANTATSSQWGGGSQTATNTQLLPIAVAPAVAPQVVPVNVNLPISVASSGGGSVDQSNTAGADASAANTAASSQKGGGGGSQTATNTQIVPIAAAPAVAPQIVPVNANVPVTVLGEAPSGDVNQSNRAYAGADAANTAASHQKAGDAKGAKDGGGDQTATNTQVLPIAAAPAVSGQVLPINANVPVNLFTTGDEGDGKGDPKAGGVDQSNVAFAGASAGNLAASSQKGGEGQTATNTQLVPVSLAPAIAPQILPINANVPVTVGNPLAVLPPLPVDPFAVLGDPVGTVTGLLPVGLPTLPVDPFAILGDPVGTITGLLPLGAVTGLLPALPALPALPVGLPSGLV